MIIQVRGTSGSGKTTVVQQIMGVVGDWDSHYVDGRKKPLYYSHGGLVVLGHYEGVDCGGGDTIGSSPRIYETIINLEFVCALVEGLLLSEDVRWTLKLEDVRALFLTTPPEECLRRIKTRQGGREPKDPARVKRKMEIRIGTIDRARQRLVKAGVVCRRCSSTQAPKIIERWISQATR